MVTRAKSPARKSAKRVVRKAVRRKVAPKRPHAERPPQSAPIPQPPELAAVSLAGEERVEELPLGMRVMEAAAQVADDYVERLGDDQFGVSVHGVLLTVVVEPGRGVARIIAPLFPVTAFGGDLMAATNEMNSRHIAYGYTYVREGEVRYAAEVLLEPFHADAIPRALQVAAAVVRGMGMEVDEETARWVGVGE